MRRVVRQRALLGALAGLLLLSGVAAADARAQLLPDRVREVLDGEPPPVALPDPPVALPSVPALPGAVAAPGVAAPASELVWGDLAPAFPGDIVVKQPDGSTFRAQLSNAEVGGALEVDGYTVVKRSDGWWTYARGRDAAGELLATAARVGRDARPSNLKAGLGRTRNLWLDARGGDLRAQAFRQLQIASWQAAQQAAAAGQPRVFRFPVLMLATWWDEEKGQTSPQFQEGNTAETFEELLDGFGGNPTGTLTEFYFESSFGQFLVQVDVFGPFTSLRSVQDRCYYGGIDPPADPLDDLDPVDSALGVGGGGAIGMAVEAVPQADATVDFSRYDNDGDGFVDFTALLHSGPDMAATGDPCHTWSHAIEAGLAGPIVEETIGLPHNTLQHGIPTTDGVMVNRLFTMPEVDLQIGVAVHEMAHALGEPDYYNPSYTSMGTGDWDVMAGGSWFGNPPGSNPTGFNPASRIFQGWITPRIVDRDTPNLALQPRELQPTPGYTVGTPDENIALVPTKTIAVGETDGAGHTWTEEDVYGLAEQGDRFVVEGYFLENWSRSVNAPPFDPKMKRQPYFDRTALGSGLMVWHFDYYRRSNVYYGANDAGSDPNRPQMDPVEFDFNDASQELQLGETRGEPQDLITSAATGITSGTRQLREAMPEVDGTPQAEMTWSGVTPPAQHADHTFTVDDNPANHQMRVSVTGLGDCTLQLLYDGKPVGGVVDAGFVGTEEFIDVKEPEPGTWTARVGDYAACGPHDGTITFARPDGVFDTTGAGDTWSNWTQQPTGWAFTNVRAGATEGWTTSLDNSERGPGITLDVVRLGTDALDVSPGFITAKDVDAGAQNRLSVPIFNNGGKDVPSVEVTVREGSTTGRVVARGTVRDLRAYSRTPFTFRYRPAAEGPLALVVTVDPSRELAERVEGNNSQRSVLEASPAGGTVLVVDDDGGADAEDSITGALASLGIPYDVVAHHADAATMRRYEAVVWETGLERYQGQLDPDDRAAIAAYLDGGGRLLLTSPRAAGALGEPAGGTNPLATEDMAPFARDYFGIAYRDTVQVGGGTVTGTDILGGSRFRIDVFPGRPLQDVFAAGKSAKGTVTPIATWDKGGDGALMGVKVQGETFRTVFLGYNLAQSVQGADTAAALRKSLGWLGVEPGGYRAPASPVLRHTAVHSAIARTAVPVKAFVAGRSATPTLRYRVAGTASWTTVAMTRTAAGVWHAVIPAAAVTTKGVEYFLTAGAARVPFTAGLPHYVSVALPL